MGLQSVWSAVRPLNSRVRDALLSFFLPSFCRLCGSLIESWDDGIACSQCWSASKVIDSVQAANAEIAFYGACGIYDGAWRETVLHLKRRPQLAPRVQRALIGVLSRADVEFDFAVPIPLHKQRLRERGFNQASVIARSTGLRVNESCLVRVKATAPHRAGTSPRQRARSLEGAFRVRALRAIENRRILLVDDVTTTGSTAREAARTLLNSGAATVGLLTIARVR